MTNSSPSVKIKFMKEKGIKNIEIADYLHENCLDSFKECELYSVIVNRWYYGFYLIAKSDLAKKYLESRYGHTHYRVGKERKNKVLGIWELIARNYDEYSVHGAGDGLFQIRNTFDYSESQSQEDFQRAAELRKELEDIFNKIGL